MKYSTSFPKVFPAFALTSSNYHELDSAWYRNRIQVNTLPLCGCCEVVNKSLWVFWGHLLSALLISLCPQNTCSRVLWSARPLKMDGVHLCSAEVINTFLYYRNICLLDINLFRFYKPYIAKVYMFTTWALDLKINCRSLAFQSGNFLSLTQWRWWLVQVLTIPSTIPQVCCMLLLQSLASSPRLLVSKQIHPGLI